MLTDTDTDTAPVLTVPDFAPTHIHQGGSDVAPCGTSLGHGVQVWDCDDVELCGLCMLAVGKLTAWVRA